MMSKTFNKTTAFFLTLSFLFYGNGGISKSLVNGAELKTIENCHVPLTECEMPASNKFNIIPQSDIRLYRFRNLTGLSQIVEPFAKKFLFGTYYRYSFYLCVNYEPLFIEHMLIPHSSHAPPAYFL